MTIRPAALALATLLAASCASVEAERIRREALAPRLDALRYAQPLDAVWTEARRLLAEKGYPLLGADAEAVGRKASPLEVVLSRAKETQPDSRGGRFLETGWGPGPSRYRLEGSPEGDRTRVVFWAIPEDPVERGRDGYPPVRGAEMELELARRLDPAAAAAIEAEVPPAPGR